MWETSGSKYLANLGIYFFSFSASYFLVLNLIKRRAHLLQFKFNIKLFKFEYIIALSVMLIIAHYLYLGYIPVIRAMGLNTIDEIAWVRTNITINNNTFFNYASSILIRAVLPFTLLYLATRKQTALLIALSLLFSFYAFSLMQKSYIVTLILPTLIYAIYNKKIIQSVFNLFLIVGIILSIGYISNPKLNPTKQPPKPTTTIKKKTPPPKSTLSPILLGLKNRVLVVPGRMVSNWFDHVPNTLPFLGVDGYRIIAKIRGKEHHDYGKDLYPIISAKFHKRGLTGTVNVASFMYEYAYFGKLGLILSGLILSSIIAFCEVLFSKHFILKLAINLYPILILSSTALTTSLLSGGWIFLILLYITYQHHLSFQSLKTV